MILRKVEITLVGPDEYPADEGSYTVWEKKEQNALAALDVELDVLQRVMFRLLPEEFILEISGSGASTIPSEDAPEIS